MTLKHALMVPVCLITLAMVALPAAAKQTLANSWQWQKLLQYNEKGVSEVQQDSFFLSPQGRIDPVSELKAAVAKLTDQTMICRFPARHMWLHQAGLVEDFDYSKCDDFIEWQKSPTIESATLVFADGYLKNPASFHGHLFIKLGDGQGNGLLDNSLNYGAKVPANVDPVTYIVKGLFGGYNARYSSQHFYRHDLSYGQVELRNLWNYKLAVSAFKAQLLSAHLYELSKTEYTYYFTSKNCAYYVARALELVANDYLVKASELTVFPSEIIKRIASPEMGLVDSIELNDSEQKRFQLEFHALSPSQQTAVQDWVEGKHNSGYFINLTEEQQKQVLITLASYYSFRQRQNPDDKDFQQLKRQVLIKLLKYSPGNNLKVVATGEYPHLGQKPTLLRVSEVIDHDGRNRTELTFRPTYYDRLQPKIGKPKNSALQMGEITVSTANSDVFIEDITVINISSLNVSSTGLPGDGGNSWRIKFGATRQRLREGHKNLASYIEGSYGWANHISNQVVTYALVGGRVHDKEIRGDSHNLTAYGTLGIEGSVKGQNWYCEASKPIAVGRHLTAQRWKTQCGMNLVSMEAFDVRVAYEHQDRSAYSIGLSYYF